MYEKWVQAGEPEPVCGLQTGPSMGDSGEGPALGREPPARLASDVVQKHKTKFDSKAPTARYKVETSLDPEVPTANTLGRRGNGLSWRIKTRRQIAGRSQGRRFSPILWILVGCWWVGHGVS